MIQQKNHPVKPGKSLVSFFLQKGEQKPKPSEFKEFLKRIFFNRGFF